jgi:hypothetical protein
MRRRNRRWALSVHMRCLSPAATIEVFEVDLFLCPFAFFSGAYHLPAWSVDGHVDCMTAFLGPVSHCSKEMAFSLFMITYLFRLTTTIYPSTITPIFLSSPFFF